MVDPPSPAPGSTPPAWRALFPAAALALLALRLWHLGPLIDAPHDWRQCDTTHYIRDFYLHGIDLLHPAVCWMGARDTVALELPLPEAVAALAYHLLGESLVVARLVFLGFYVGAALYLHRLVGLVFGATLARLAILVYLALPLGLYYSRAVHIDFAALLAAHAMAYHFLLAVPRRPRRPVAARALAAALALCIKAPYAVAWALPLAGVAHRERAWAWVLRGALAYALAGGAFLLWWQHVQRVNAAAPDWGYLPGYQKMTHSWGWYLGSLQQRAAWQSWWTLLQRLALDVVGPGGLGLGLWGLARWRRLPGRRFLALWLAGLGLYVLLFFNLNLVHDYYQLPLLAPAAILCAGGLLQLGRRPALRAALLALLAGANVAYAELSYYQQSPGLEEAADLIRRHTPPRALVIVTYGEMDCRDPRLLFRARRRGWSLPQAALRPAALRRLQQEEGAAYWAFVGPGPPRGPLGAFTAGLPAPRILTLRSLPYRLTLFDLRRPGPGPARGP